MPKVVNINHIGVVVPNIKKSLEFWQGVLGIDLNCLEQIPTMNLELAWLPVRTTSIELVEPTTQENNEYYDFLKSQGSGLHHICLEVDDIDAMLKILKNKNIKIKDGVVHELPGRKLAFLEREDCDGILVELYELTCREIK